MAPKNFKVRRGPRPDDPRVRFLVELARALGTYSTASYRLEEAVSICAQSMGLYAHVFSTPTSVFLSIEEDGEYDTYLTRITPGEVNLSKLRSIDTIFNAVFAKKMTPLTGIRKIKEIVLEPDRVPLWAHVLSFGGASATASVLFGGHWQEMLGAALIGGTCGALIDITAKNREYARLFDFLAGFFAAVIAGLLSLLIGPYTTTISVLAGIIVLIPGLTLTTAMTELATRNVVSGSARLVGAIMILVLLGFGAAAGDELVNVLLDPPPSLKHDGFSTHWRGFAAVMGAGFFVVLFRARLNDWWVMLASVLCAYYSSRFGVATFGLEFGICFAAACVGVLGNLFAQFADRPAVTVVLPGLIMLVPGSIGFRSVQSFMGAETLSGVESAFRVVVIGAALVVGLLLSNAVIRPRKVL